MSKKEIRRAARDAYPKAKRASTARGRGGGAYGKRNPTVGRTGTGAPAVKPPSVKRAAILGILFAFFYFAVIQWVWKSNATAATNIIFSVVGAFVFTGVFYLTDRFKYRRYLRKQKDSSK